MSEPTSQLVLDYGTEVFYRGIRHVIRQESQDFVTVLLFEPESGKLVHAPITEITATKAPLAPQQDLGDIDPDQWEAAEKKYRIIEPLLEMPRLTVEAVEERAHESNVSRATIYAWIDLYKRVGKISAFLRRPRRDKGQIGLPEEVEKIVGDTIKNLYLHKQKRNAAKIIREINRLCAKNQLQAPHANTVRARIKRLSAFQKTQAREGTKAAENEQLLIAGSFPGANAPLSVIQIDHTPVDLVLVDDVYRQPIGRPYLTLAIDVFSRMVLGFYLSFDKPGNISLGLCLAHAFLPKEKFLAKLDIEAQWPCWGIPRTIHADNAKEFHGLMLQRACQEYGINLEWRPVAKPRYGAHIERLLGTLNNEIHGLEGTTFSNVQQRGDYDSDAEATMSIKEFEHWFTLLCVDVYHQREHSHLGIAPIAKWHEGILGTKKTPGIGMPARITNEIKLKLDLMPFELRTVQHYGIVWDHVEYQHHVLRRWVDSKDPDQPKLKRKFLCRRDPRDISTIWFFDPEVKEYFPIPYRNTSHPAISIWELREAERRALEEQPQTAPDEARIFAAYDKMQQIVEQAKKTTRKMRRDSERKRLGVTGAEHHLRHETAASKASQPAMESSAPPSGYASTKTYAVEEIDFD